MSLTPRPDFTVLSIRTPGTLSASPNGDIDYPFATSFGDGLSSEALAVLESLGVPDLDTLSLSIDAPPVSAGDPGDPADPDAVDAPEVSAGDPGDPADPDTIDGPEISAD